MDTGAHSVNQNVRREKEEGWLGRDAHMLSDETVAEYGKKFMELARYVITFIMNEEDKCTHFEEGLRTSIRALVTACVGSLDFSKLVEAAIRIEKCLVEEDEEKMVEGEESSPLLDRGQEKEDNKEAEKWTMFYFRQGSHWFSDKRPRFLEC
ncbi:zf-CCHC domain-containing protein [Cucumis melo var. makuwa]|uniref:Zf-CCHC domain-containing protein n=1 Tax=Cucumis melo var. makuwa TaxID=1194695 RepID=A0A5A7TP59_CUCMM|nr:zf-CCHC domain-containing protein [Cucumis melo var. makuwa]